LPPDGVLVPVLARDGRRSRPLDHHGSPERQRLGLLEHARAAIFHADVDLAAVARAATRACLARRSLGPSTAPAAAAAWPAGRPLA
jgi:hypothetical protein